MSQSSRQVYESRTSREIRRTDGNNFVQGYEEHLSFSSGSPNELVVRSYNFPTDISFQDLVHRKNVLHELMHEFESNKGDRVIFDPYKSQDYLKRLFLLQNQIQGLMRTGMIYEGGQGKASIDYGNLINEKQNQINQLQRKITSIESSSRKYDHRIKQLEDQITRLHSIIVQKNRVIQNFGGKNIKQWGGNRDAVGYADKLMADLDRFKKNNSPSFGMLDGVVEAWILNLPDSSNLKQKLRAAETRLVSQRRYRDFVMNKLSEVSRLYKSQINELSTRVGSSSRIGYDQNILKAISLESDGRSDPLFESVFAGYITGSDFNRYDRDTYISRTVQVPVQDSRTKALIYKLAKQMNRLYKKYPSLSKQIDPKLAQFFSQEMLQVIEVDQVDRLIQIVKIQPQIVKVDNVYAYSSEKSRKVEFHLRVLIKALLEQMQKMKAKTGIAPQIDQGVIGMIRQQIMDVVDVDDILRVYRTVPKIVEVQKVIQKVVQKIVQVPRFVTAETRVETPVEVARVNVVQNTVNVPVQHPVITNLIQQKIVQVPQIINQVVPHPQIHQKIVQTIVQRPQVVTVENVVTLEKEVPKIVQVPGAQKVVQIIKPEIIQCVKQVIVETRQEVEVIKQVQVIVQKVVQVIKQVPKVYEIQKIVEKVIPQKQYIQNQRVVNHVTERYEPVTVIKQKIVPIIKIQEKIVQVPQIVQKIVTVVQVRPQIVQVKVVQQRPIIQKQLQIVQRIKQVPVVEIREVEKIIQKIVQVPVIHEKIIVQKQYVKQPVIETVQKIIHKDVEIQRPVIMYEDRIVEVDRVINHVVQVPQIINIEKQTLVPYEKVINQVVAEPTIIEKVIQKIVQVPKVVEVEKIVEKIVPVPRIVQKVIEVEKIVQKIVKQLVIQEKIVQKQVRVQVPVFQDRLIEIEKPVNYYQRVQVPKQVRQQVMVKDTVTHTVPQIREIHQGPRIVVQTRQVEVPMVVQKICTLRATDNKFIELKQTEIVPVQIQLPVDIIKQKIVPIEHVVPDVQVEKAVIQKIVQINVEADPRVIEVESVAEKLVVQKQVQIVQNRIPYYQDRIVQVQVMREKIVKPIQYQIQRVVEVPVFIDKIVQRMVNIPKVYEIEKRNDVVVKDPIIVPIERIVPQLITLNKSIQNIVDRIVEVPRLVQKLQTIDQIHEKIVPQHQIETRVEEIRTIQQKQVIIEKIKQVENTIHCVNEVLKTAQRIIQRPTEPIIVCEDRIMEVPFIVEKIVEKIVVMPQVVEVLKYVHELVDNEALLSSQQAVVEDAEYTRLARNVNLQVTKLKGLLGDLRPDSPQYRRQITIIENFLAEFNKFVAFPRIREIINERKVDNVIEKDRIVRVPVHSSEDAQRNLASAVLIDKLINELRRFKQANPNMKWQLDEDILHIFGGQLEPISKYYGNDYNKVLDEYVRAVHNRFSSVGPWSSDHQIMLKSFIQERFDLAYNYKKAAADSAKTKARYQSVLQSYGKMKQQNERMRKSFDIFSSVFPMIIKEGRRQNTIDQVTENRFNQAFRGLTQLVVTQTITGGAYTERLGPLQNERFHSMLREKQQEIIRLKDRIRELMMDKSGHSHHHSWQEVVSKVGMISGGGQVDCSKYKQTIRVLQGQIRQLQSQIIRLRTFESKHKNCTAEIDTLRAENQRLRLDVSQLRSPKQSRGTKYSTTSPKEPGSDRQKDSSQGSNSLYGLNYLEYANLDDQGDDNAGRIQKGVYRSGNYGGTDRYGGGGYNTQQYSTQYVATTSKQTISSSEGMGGAGGYSVSVSGAGGRVSGSGAGGVSGAGLSGSRTGMSSSRGGSSTYQSGYRQQAVANNQGGTTSYQSIQYSRGSANSGGRTEYRQARYEYSSQGGDSNTNSRQVIRGTARLQDSSSSSQRQMYDSKKGSFR